MLREEKGRGDIKHLVSISLFSLYVCMSWRYSRSEDRTRTGNLAINSPSCICASVPQTPSYDMRERIRQIRDTPMDTCIKEFVSEYLPGRPIDRMK